MSDNRRMMCVTFSDRSVWKFPAIIVAELRAHYLAAHDSVNIEDHNYAYLTYNQVFTQELAASDDDLLDYATDNMDWSDVKDHVILLVVGTGADYQKEWVNASKYIESPGYI